MKSRAPRRINHREHRGHRGGEPRLAPVTLPVEALSKNERGGASRRAGTLHLWGFRDFCHRVHRVKSSTPRLINHRDTEGTEGAARGLQARARLGFVGGRAKARPYKIVGLGSSGRLTESPLRVSCRSCDTFAIEDSEERRGHRERAFGFCHRDTEAQRGGEPMARPYRACLAWGGRGGRLTLAGFEILISEGSDCEIGYNVCQMAI